MSVEIVFGATQQLAPGLVLQGRKRRDSANFASPSAAHVVDLMCCGALLEPGALLPRQQTPESPAPTFIQGEQLMTINLCRRTITGLTAAIFLLAGIAVATPAIAAVSQLPTSTLGMNLPRDVDPNGALGQLDPAATGTLTIHKHPSEDIDTSLPHDGTQQQVNGQGVAGVGFSVWAINYDPDGDGVAFSSATDWEFFSTLIPQAIDPAWLVPLYANTTALVTDANGVAVVPNLPIGAYLVEETQPATWLDANGRQLVTLPSRPFIVTMPAPATDAQTGQGYWNFDIHAYPKNDVLDVAKTVQDAATWLGDTANNTITFGIDGHFPYDVDGAPVIKYQFTDQLDVNLAFSAVSNVRLEDNAGNVVVSLDPTDYTVTPASGGAAGALVTITLTQSGLDKANAWTITAAQADAGMDPEPRLKAEVTVTVPDGVATPVEFTNTATLTAQMDGSGETSVVSPPATVDYSAVDLTKTDAKTAALLDGAVFALYSGSDVVNGAVATDAQPITSVTTVAGKATVDGLYVGDSTSATNGVEYCFVETSAPAAHYLDSTPHCFTLFLDNDSTAAGNQVLALAAITNQPIPAILLPFTGGHGTWVWMALGIVVIGGGAVLTMKLTKRGSRDAATDTGRHGGVHFA